MIDVMESLKTYLSLTTLLFIGLISSTLSQSLEGSGEEPEPSTTTPSSFIVLPSSSMTYSTSTFLPSMTMTSSSATMTSTSTATATMTSTSTTTTPSTTPQPLTTRQTSTSITLDSPSVEDRQQFENEAPNALATYYRGQMGDLFNSLGTLSFRYFIGTDDAGAPRSLLEIFYTVTLPNTQEAAAEFAEAQAELTTTGNFTALGAAQSVLQTTLLGNTYFRNNRTGVAAGRRRIACDIFEILEGCSEGEVCDVDDVTDKTVCVVVAVAVSDDFPWKVGLGVGIPLFVLLFSAACCCCCYCCLAGRRKPVEDDTSSITSVYLFTPMKFRIHTFTSLFPVYGSYYRETRPEAGSSSHSRAWSSRESEPEDDSSDDADLNRFNFQLPQMVRKT